jgi:hypothetical protein
MKKIGTTNDGMLLEIGAGDLAELRAILRARVFEYVDGIVKDLAAAVGLPWTPTPVQSAGTNPLKREIKAAKREIAKGKGSEPVGVRTCPDCGKEFNAHRKDQVCCSKECRKRFDNNNRRRAEKNTKTAAPAKPLTRAGVCETCKKTFEARVFGPVPHHCPACRPGGKKTTAAARAPALRPPPKALRPAMPSDDTGKAARLDAIRRIALKEAEELASDVIGGIEA